MVAIPGLDPLSLALGLFGGGGSTSQQTTVTSTNAFSANNTPSTVVNIGGGVDNRPATPITSNPSAAATAALTPSGGSGLALPSFSGGYSQADAASYRAIQSGPLDIIMNNLPLIALGLGGVFLLKNMG